jgi:S-adenosylmethionine:diacylglycerol 3-amino-3-carboxypropyl transferase
VLACSLQEEKRRVAEAQSRRGRRRVVWCGRTAVRRGQLGSLESTL